MLSLNYRGTVTRLATVIALLLSITAAAPVLARDKCSIRTIAGRWMFATEVGQIDLSVLNPALAGVALITAIGTMNIGRDGNLSGEFDATIASPSMTSSFFLSNIMYSGPVTVNPDCTGTLTFETTAGTMRTDSIVVLSRNEIWAMSQDPLNPWTYRVRRISK